MNSRRGKSAAIAYHGKWGALERAVGKVSWWARLAIAAGIGALVPTLTGSDYWTSVGVSTLLLAMLARAEHRRGNEVIFDGAPTSLG